jgi:hypothetical protein
VSAIDCSSGLTGGFGVDGYVAGVENEYTEGRDEPSDGTVFAVSGDQIFELICRCRYEPFHYAVELGGCVEGHGHIVI